MKLERRRFLGEVSVLVVAAAFSPAFLRGQDDFSVLRINEVISDNATQGPTDKKGKHQDMVEIYNSGDKPLAMNVLAISDTPDAVPPNDGNVLPFPAGTNIPAKGFVMVFLSGNKDATGDCQTDINLGLAKDGTEPVTLWGPKAVDGKRSILDQVWLPPLDEDVSFGRFPDGAGPAPVPLEETLLNFHFYPKGTSTFGTCGPAPCSTTEAPCKGAANGPGGNLAPSVNRKAHSTNHPAANEPVFLTVSVEDDKEPTPPNIKNVVIRYTVDGVAQTEIPMTYDASSGVQTGVAQGIPLERWTLWTGSIPGQPEGARVDFTFAAEDVEGLTSTDPSNLCEPNVGPCDDIGLPGPGCVKLPPPGLQYFPCKVPFHYVSGYSPPEALRGLVINEVMANQTKTLPDRSQSPAKYDDYFELYNGTAAAVDLSGRWLADKPFEPQGWQFPDGSSIAAGEYLIVWLDSDGGRCPRPNEEAAGDGQKCPDPTDASKQSYHANFALAVEGDQLYLFDRAESGYGVLHGVEFEAQSADVSISLTPNGDREGTFEPTPTGTPGAANGSTTGGPSFRRGDANTDCSANIADAVFTLRYLFQGGDNPQCPDAADADDNGSIQLTDAVFLLNYLFQGGTAIPAPGELTPGIDPTPDGLGECQSTGCTGG